MSSIVAALDALDAAVELVGAADIEELPAPERFAAIERLEGAVSAGGTLIPMTDLIRAAVPSYNYFAVFDGVTGQSLWLGRSKRLASADQRIMLLAKYRGCSAPGCTVNGYNSQVHHAAKDWKRGGTNDFHHPERFLPKDDEKR